MLNLFDNVNFDPIVTPPNSTLGAAGIFQSTAAYRDPTNNFDPGGRLGQISFRFNW
jgi:hypothetical protein